MRVQNQRAAADGSGLPGEPSAHCGRESAGRAPSEPTAPSAAAWGTRSATDSSPSHPGKANLTSAFSKGRLGYSAPRSDRSHRATITRFSVRPCAAPWTALHPRIDPERCSRRHWIEAGPAEAALRPVRPAGAIGRDLIDDRGLAAGCASPFGPSPPSAGASGGSSAGRPAPSWG